MGVYPNQDFVHIDVREVDVRWVDGALHGESANARYFSRSPLDTLPENAPRLAYDEPRPMPTQAMAAISYKSQMPRGISDGY